VPILTTAPAGSRSALPGAIGNPDTMPLVGGRPLSTEERHGFRVSGGVWVTDGLAVEGGYFQLVDRTLHNGFQSTGAAGSPFLTIPIIVADTGIPSRVALGAPGAEVGSAIYALASQLQGAEVNATWRVADRNAVKIDALAGFRWLNLDEQFTATYSSFPVPGNLNTVGATGFDQFQTRNNFYGGQFGVRLRADSGRFFVVGTGKVALGGVEERTHLSGSTTRPIGVAGVAPVTSTAGILVLGTNTGGLSRTRLAWAPEVGVKVGVRIADWMFATVGYDFLYISDVARPGNTIDDTYNRSQAFGRPLVGDARPTFVLRDSSFYGQGLNVGLSFQF
jgi:hypothetical protein